jgi:PAS domain S-box-containing protein
LATRSKPRSRKSKKDNVSSPARGLEEFNRAILDSALDCIITMDATGRVREFNPAAERTFGYTRPEAIGKELAELIIPPALRARHREGLARYLKTGKGPVIGQRIEISGMRKDGSEILVELAINAFKIEGSPVFTAYLRDITDRKRAEETSQRLAAIIEFSDDAIIGTDLTGIITSWNKAGEHLFGYAANEVIGQSVIATLIPLDRHDEEPRILERIRRGEHVDHYETIRRHKDGTLLNISLTVSPIKDESGNVIGASKIARDISARKKNDEALRRQAELLDQTHDAIVVWDKTTGIEFWNRGAEALYGWNRDEVRGRITHELFQTQGAPADFEERLGEGSWTGELVHTTRDGRRITVESRHSVFRQNGRTLIFETTRDVTERVRADRRRVAQYTIATLLAGSRTLSEAGEEIIRVIAGTGSWIAGSIWLCDDNCETLHCAATWHGGGSRLETFAQATRAAMLQNAIGLPGRVVSSFKATWISDVTRDSNFPRVEAAIEAGLHGAFAFPLSAHGKIKGVLELFCAELAQPDDDLLQLVQALGSQIGLFIHRQQIEEELQHQKDTAEAANAAKDQFLASLSHELRTPLNPVLIWAGGTLKQPDLAPDLQEGLQMVCRNIELEARLIDDLLDLTRITRGKLQLHLRRCDAHELLRHAMEIVRSEAAVRRLNIEVHLDATNHHIFVDAPRVQQVFWNVLRNAYKFTPDRGRVTVRTSNRTGELIIEINDNGVGIESKFLEKIFNAFEQVDSRREGLGLGLAISKAIVEMHDGSIHAESSGLGQGAAFIISLKLAPAEKNAGSTSSLTSP